MQFYHNLPIKPAEKMYWEQLHGSSQGLALSLAARQRPIVVITPDIFTGNRLEEELHFFAANNDVDKLPILTFPDWETLPYDHFSPHEDIISQRLLALNQLPTIKSGILIIAATTLMQRLLPRDYLEANSLILNCNESINIAEFRQRLERCGYYCVSKVMEHGEFAVRGSIIDLFPMGSDQPLRIDLFDQEIDSIRLFDPETQRTTTKIESFKLLPAKEYPLTPEAVSTFRQNWRSMFSGDPTKSPLYQNISNAKSHPGIEYYLPLFFAKTHSIFDYLPTNSLIVTIGNLEQVMSDFWQKIKDRYEQLGHDQSYPILPPQNIFLPVEQVFGALQQFPQILINPEEYRTTLNKNITSTCFNTQKYLDISIDRKAVQPLAKLANFINTAMPTSRILFCAESGGRRESLLELLKTINIQPATFNSWHDFLNADALLGIVVAPIEQGLYQPRIDSAIINTNNTAINIANIHLTNIILITETQLFGQQQVMQRRLRKKTVQDPEAIVRDLTELHVGAPVVHIDHGIGRYLGLQTLTTDGQNAEFLVLEYADSVKLYVPVSALNLISRYTGVDAEHAPLNHLGSKQWEKTKREAREKIRDVAAELLEIYAERQAKSGFAFTVPKLDYQRFAAAFPFEETPDQQRAIAEVITDMTQPKSMDRLICGDVGFGKTEVAMRAAFIAVNNDKQVAILTPTTLLAQQHFSNFKDRFADWPVRVELLSRFRSAKEQIKIMQKLENGEIDIIIGTHKLLQPNIQFKDLGLLVVDEEHRFGVRQKERIKSLRPNIDILTLTATPIPRTLNMAFANIRDFSIIATPPARRLTIKTFIHQRNNHLIKEAITREILRGGQVYFLHNDVATIDKTARELQELLPTISIAVAHGQMPEQRLEYIMRDFYHLHYNVLVCSTIIESGIDIPTANTIIIDRADRFGLAQLHQLRGRVGRSHHQAYAYLLVPPPSLMTPDAKRRLDAIVSMEDLGAGFTLATHDLEIRGAGDLLGEEQSGEIQNIGFSLYMDMLEKAVTALKEGKKIDLDLPAQQSLEIDLHIHALIPNDYINDVNIRLVLYKRIANIKNAAEADDLQVELIDRFGLLPDATKNLFKIAQLKSKAEPLGIHKITAGNQKGMIEFFEHPNIDPLIIIKLIQRESKTYKLKGPNTLEFILQQHPTLQVTAGYKIEFVNHLLDKLTSKV